MGEAAVVEIDNFPRAIILIYLVIAFSPFGYYLAIHIVAEKERKLKEFLKILGLHDTAFWYVSVRCNLLFIKGKRKKVYVKKYLKKTFLGNLFNPTLQFLNCFQSSTENNQKLRYSVESNRETLEVPWK